MLRIPLAVILLLSTATAESFGAEALKKIRIASKAAGESLVPYLVFSWKRHRSDFGTLYKRALYLR